MMRYIADLRLTRTHDQWLGSDNKHRIWYKLKVLSNARIIAHHIAKRWDSNHKLTKIGKSGHSALWQQAIAVKLDRRDLADDTYHALTKKTTACLSLKFPIAADAFAGHKWKRSQSDTLKASCLTTFKWLQRSNRALYHLQRITYPARYNTTCFKDGGK